MTATPHELLIQSVAELDRGLRVLRLEVDVAVTGQRRKSAPMNTLAGLNAIVGMMDALVPAVMDRSHVPSMVLKVPDDITGDEADQIRAAAAGEKFRTLGNPNTQTAPFPSPPALTCDDAP
ncbi:hypothetical protein [Jiangella muralis]|uniref:hypothetical protein n=1 Tax=Jiangella muralis TaxID=702383 RepID=UPI00069F7D36|nr:hypothetical protein [Jiangella muralis]